MSSCAATTIEVAEGQVWLHEDTGERIRIAEVQFADSWRPVVDWEYVDKEVLRIFPRRHGAMSVKDLTCVYYFDAFDYDALEKCACCDPPKLFCPFGCIELRPDGLPTQYRCPECERTIYVRRYPQRCQICEGEGSFRTDGSEGAVQLIPCNCERGVVLAATGAENGHDGPPAFSRASEIDWETYWANQVPITEDY